VGAVNTEPGQAESHSSKRKDGSGRAAPSYNAPVSALVGVELLLVVAIEALVAAAEARPPRFNRRSTSSKLALCVACGPAAVSSNKGKEPDPPVGVYIPLRFQQPKEEIMPLLIPILIGVPVVFGGGWVIYHFVH
jgi:hypothetical protein